MGKHGQTPWLRKGHSQSCTCLGLTTLNFFDFLDFFAFFHTVYIFLANVTG